VDYEQTHVVKVKDRDPEQFVFLVIDHQTFRVTRMSYPAMNEDELWASLHKMGTPDDDISFLIESARQNPV
jgi:hypothetical protein